MPNQQIINWDGKNCIYAGNTWKYYSFQQNKFIDYLPNSITVKFDSTFDFQNLPNFISAHGLVLKRLNRFGFYDFALSNYAQQLPISVAIKNEAFVDKVIVHQTGQLHGGTNDELYNRPGSDYEFWFSAMQLDSLFPYSTGMGSSSTVAVIDGGFYDHPDFHIGNKSNIWTNLAEINGLSGVDDNSNGYIDDFHGWNFALDSNDVFTILPTDDKDHGLIISSIISAVNNNNIYASSIGGGWNSEGVKSMLLNITTHDTIPAGGYRTVMHTDMVDDAIVYAVDNGADVINLSFGVGDSLAPDLDAAIQYAHDHNVALVAASPNFSGTFSAPCWKRFHDYPGLHPLVYTVGSSVRIGSSEQAWTGNMCDHQVDFIAPGKYSYSLSSTQDLFTSGNKYTNPFTKTANSWATPSMAALIALLKDQVPCLNLDAIDRILKNTIDKINSSNPGYLNGNQNTDYFSSHAHYGKSEYGGYGRINVWKALQYAQTNFNCNDTSLDLFCRDCPADAGEESMSSYKCHAQNDLSPDIWVRTPIDDGEQITISQDFSNSINLIDLQDTSHSMWLYVRVHNRHNRYTTGNEKLDLHWSKAATSNSWPDNKFDSTSGCGGRIVRLDIPVLKPFESKILKYEWKSTDFPQQLKDSFANGVSYPCLLANIISVVDSYNTPSTNEHWLKVNNNMALANLMILSTSYLDASPSSDDPIGKARGHIIYWPNDHPISRLYDFDLGNLPEQIGNGPFDHGRVIITFTENDYDAIVEDLDPGIECDSTNNCIYLYEPTLLENVLLPPNSMTPIRVGFEKFAEDSILAEFSLSITQYYADSSGALGAYTFIDPNIRTNTFEADAGDDILIDSAETVHISAEDIGQPAVYNWYDEQGVLVHSGQSFYFQPTDDMQLSLQVQAVMDGSYASDEVSISLRSGSIVNVFPNPVSTEVSIEYQLENASSAFLALMSPYSTNYDLYTLDVNTNMTQINLSKNHQEIIRSYYLWMECS